MGSWEVKQIPQDNTKLKFRTFWFQNHNLSSTLSHFPKQAFCFRTKVRDKGQNSPNEPESHYNQGLGERGNVWREIKVDRIPGMVSHDILLYPFSTLRMTMTTTTTLVLFISLTSSPSILLFNHYLPNDPPLVFFLSSQHVKLFPLLLVPAGNNLPSDLDLPLRITQVTQSSSSGWSSPVTTA